MEWIWWLAAALVFALVEVIAVQLIFLMLAGGATAAAVVAAVGAPVWAQILTFAAVSGFLLLAVRPLALRRLTGSSPGYETNIAAHVGRPAVVVLDVTEHAGRVKLQGEVWTARAAAPGTTFPVGSAVRVVRIEGATAIVEAAPATTPQDL